MEIAEKITLKDVQKLFVYFCSFDEFKIRVRETPELISFLKVDNNQRYILSNGSAADKIIPYLVTNFGFDFSDEGNYHLLKNTWWGPKMDTYLKLVATLLNAECPCSSLDISITDKKVSLFLQTLQWPKYQQRLVNQNAKFFDTKFLKRARLVLLILNRQQSNGFQKIGNPWRDVENLILFHLYESEKFLLFN